MMEGLFWLFWRSLDEMERTPCGTYVWAVVKADLYSGFRIAAKIATKAGLAFLVPVVSILQSAALYRHWYTVSIRKASYFHRLAESLQSQTHKALKQEKEGKKQSYYEALEEAVQIPLPISPEPNVNQSPTHAKSPFHTTQQPMPGPGSPWLRQADASVLPTLTELLNAEAFLDLMLSMPTSNKSPYAWKLPHLPATVFLPKCVV